MVPLIIIWKSCGLTAPGFAPSLPGNDESVGGLVMVIVAMATRTAVEIIPIHRQDSVQFIAEWDGRILRKGEGILSRHERYPTIGGYHYGIIIDSVVVECHPHRNRIGVTVISIAMVPCYSVPVEVISIQKKSGPVGSSESFQV